MWRLGKILWKRNAAADAGACFGQALQLACEQQAKSLELRAAGSLIELLHASGHSTAARETLSPIHAWFTEGFETYDLHKARKLLDSLA